MKRRKLVPVIAHDNPACTMGALCEPCQVDWDRWFPPQRSNENCTNPYFSECLPLCGDAAKESE